MAVNSVPHRTYGASQYVYVYVCHHRTDNAKTFCGKKQQNSTINIVAQFALFYRIFFKSSASFLSIDSRPSRCLCSDVNTMSSLFYKSSRVKRTAIDALCRSVGGCECIEPASKWCKLSCNNVIRQIIARL